MLEWKEYCDYKYGGDAKVTPDKVFTFLFYQAYREKKPSGGKYGNACSTGVNKRRKMTKSLKGYKKFNEHDFENVLALTMTTVTTQLEKFRTKTTVTSRTISSTTWLL